VSKTRIGQQVWTWNAQRGRPFGTAAEYVCLPEDQTVAMPKGVSIELGAGFGVPAMTAYFSLFREGSLAERDVLVTGAAGAVGFYATQFARLGQARSLTATVSSEAKAKVAAAAGATNIVNYKVENVAERVMQVTEQRGVDRISEVDFGGNLTTTIKVMRQDCAIGAYASRGVPEPRLPFYPLLFANTVVHFIQCYAIFGDLRAAAHRDLVRWSEENGLVHPEPTILPLDKIAEAHELVENSRVIGKVMVSL
jgi:NADPH2:quinone reductase